MSDITLRHESKEPRVPPALVSVIICTRNRSKLVTRAIDSVLAQTGVKVEIIVVDDCSTDDTVSVLASRYGEKIKLVRLAENMRVAAATNRGFSVSSGEFIALLGDDDYWSDTEKLARQLAIFDQAGPRLGVTGTWWSERFADGTVKARCPKEPDDWPARVLEGGSLICGSTALVSRSAWTRVGGLDERMPRGTDSDLFRGIILSGYLGFVLPTCTTVVDVGHGLNRITTRRGLGEARRIAWAHGYVIWKYHREFIRRPRLLLRRFRNLVLQPLRALRQ